MQSMLVHNVIMRFLIDCNENLLRLIKSCYWWMVTHGLMQMDN